MGDNDTESGPPSAAEGQWEPPSPDVWIPFRNALKRAYDAMSVGDETEGVLDLSISALGTRIRDGVIRFEASRTERRLQYEGHGAEYRSFDGEDKAAFATFLYSTCKGRDEGELSVEGRVLSLIDFEPFSGDFKYQIESSSPPWKVLYSAWDLRLSRADVDACWPPIDEPPAVKPAGIAELVAKSTKGRPAAGWWPTFAEELATYIHEVGIPAGQGNEGQSALIDTICERLARQGKPEPSRSTIQPVINAVLRRLREERH